MLKLWEEKLLRGPQIVFEAINGSSVLVNHIELVRADL